MELEKLQKLFLDLQDKFNKVNEEKVSLEKKNEELVEKNTSLQDSNHKLFLRVTNEKVEEIKEDEKKISLDNIIENLKGGN